MPEMDMASVQREPVARALEVLAWIAEHPETPWSVRQVARDMNTSPTTVHRIFGIFEARNLLQKDGSGGYLPSIALYKLCRSIVAQDVPIGLARTHLDALAEQCDETVMLGAYDASRLQMIYIDVRQAHHPVQHIVVPYVWRPIYAGATGLAILAFLPEAERQAVYANGLDQLTDRTIVDPKTLERKLAKIRKAGYAFTRGYQTAGTVGIAAPVFDSDHRVYGDVCITLPDQRFDDHLTESLGQAAVATAAAITEQLENVGYLRTSSMA